MLWRIISMEIISGIANPYEKYLCDKASLTDTPIGGNFELLPYCNMDCKMCYIRMSKQDTMVQGGLLPKEFWINLAKDAAKQGLLFILLTGGEPLLYPEFFELYETLQSMGFILTINTNGTLIDEKIARFFGEHIPRRLNITLYGKDDETYGRLCGNPHGFSQVEYAIQLLKKYNVPVKLNCSVTPYNYLQLDDMRACAEKWEIPIEIAYYMFPPNRKSQKSNCETHRMTPVQTANIAYDIETYKLSEEERLEKAKALLYRVEHIKEEKPFHSGFKCRAANAGFWVNWKGKMTPCGMLNQPSYNLKENSFIDCWTQMVEDVSKIYLSKKCHSCNKKSLCQQCASSAMAETGRFDGESEYLCEFCDAYLEILKKEVEQ